MGYAIRVAGTLWRGLSPRQEALGQRARAASRRGARYHHPGTTQVPRRRPAPLTPRQVSAGLRRQRGSTPHGTLPMRFARSRRVRSSPLYYHLLFDFLALSLFVSRIFR